MGFLDAGFEVLLTADFTDYADFSPRSARRTRRNSVFLDHRGTEFTEINALRMCWGTYSVAAYSLSRCKHLPSLYSFNQRSFGASRKADKGGRWLLVAWDWLLVAWDSLLVAWDSLLVAHSSLFIVRCSLWRLCLPPPIR